MVMECLWIKAEGTVPRVFQSRSTQLQSRGFLSLSLMICKRYRDGVNLCNVIITP